ncbi:MAG: leucine-rich repeat domain-containing protein [Bacteroidales bacterium]|nr:leucine-rich repeat domain-containing protein [Bacteroidales bacterium]
MKHKLFLFAVIMTAMALPHVVRAYSFSAVAPSGQTLYYNIVDGEAQVTSQYVGSGYSTYPMGDLIIPSTVTNGSNTYTVTSIGNKAFYGCTGLTSVTIGSGVTSIGDQAFYWCTGLTYVTIPNSVTSIGQSAFNGCSGLTSVTIPSSVTEINGGVFSQCHSLTSVTIPNSVTSIGYDAFSYCTGLTSVTIPNSVTWIGGFAFRGCSGLTSVTIPNSVSTIDDRTFAECTSLTSVTIGSGVTSIGYKAFEDCTGLTSVTIPSSVTSIAVEAFFCCSGLTSVTIGSGVTSIGAGAFEDCSGLTEITSLASVAPQLRDNAFRGVDDTIPVNIPCGSQTSYQSRFSGWTWFFCNFIENCTQGIGDVEGNDILINVLDGRIRVEGIADEEVRVYDIAGRMVPNRSLPLGVYMVKVGNHPARKVVVVR